MVWTFFPNSGGAATIIAAHGFNPGLGVLNYGQKGGALAIEFSPLSTMCPENWEGPTRYSFSQVVLSGDHPVAPRHPSIEGNFGGSLSTCWTRHYALERSGGPSRLLAQTDRSG